MVMILAVLVALPVILYDGYGQKGKDIARGLEQRRFEQLGGLEGTANKQNPVGQGNARRTEYLNAADEHLNSKQTGTKREVNANYGKTNYLESRRFSEYQAA